MTKAAFILGAAAGYVLGTRAGRDRYEQLKEASRRMTENPTVQETAGLLRAQAGGMAGTAKEKMNTKLHNSKIGERIPGVHGSDRTADEQESAYSSDHQPTPAMP